MVPAGARILRQAYQGIFIYYVWLSLINHRCLFSFVFKPRFPKPRFLERCFWLHFPSTFTVFLERLSPATASHFVSEVRGSFPRNGDQSHDREPLAHKIRSPLSASVLHCHLWRSDENLVRATFLTFRTLISSRCYLCVKLRIIA